MIDFEAVWASGRIASCAPWAQAEYTWLYGLADAYGCFELTNSRVIWGKVAAIRKNLSLERLEQIINEFRDKGLLFTWEQDGKLYGHWTNSDKPGRLPAPSLRERYRPSTPKVPVEQLSAYVEAKKTNGIAEPHAHLNEASMTMHTQGRIGKDRDGHGKGSGETKIAQASPSRCVSGFDEFWSAYPRKEAKPRAVKAWRKIPAGEYPQILADIERRKRSEDWKRDGGRFIPHPASYLNERRWEDADAMQQKVIREETPEIEAEPWRNRK
jgi:hypothetical protein